jgi:hypothetical protein
LLEDGKKPDFQINKKYFLALHLNMEDLHLLDMFINDIYIKNIYKLKKLNYYKNALYQNNPLKRFDKLI